MPENTPDQEPSIEEILSSIRQIIADDDEEPAPAPAAEPEEEEDDVLELTEVVEEAAPPPPPPPRPAPRPAPPKMEIDLRDNDLDDDFDDEDDGGDASILTDSAASAALEGFARLTSNMAIDRSGTGAVTIEDIVRELMRPMLRNWLDTNLPPLIEKLVVKELDKIARKALDE